MSKTPRGRLLRAAGQRFVRLSLGGPAHIPPHQSDHHVQGMIYSALAKQTSLLESPRVRPYTWTSPIRGALSFDHVVLVSLDCRTMNRPKGGPTMFSSSFERRMRPSKPWDLLSPRPRMLRKGLNPWNHLFRRRSPANIPNPCLFLQDHSENIGRGICHLHPLWHPLQGVPPSRRRRRRPSYPKSQDTMQAGRESRRPRRRDGLYPKT